MTVRSAQGLLDLLADQAPIDPLGVIKFKAPVLDQEPRAVLRDIVSSLAAIAAANRFDVSTFTGFVGDGVNDDSAAVTAAQAAANLTPGSILYFPPNKTVLSSVTLAPAANSTVYGYGATYLYSGAGTALQLGVNYGKAFGLKLQKSGAPGASVGLAVGTSGLTGHYSRLYDLEITGFNDGVVTQLSFYCGFNNVNSHANITRNWRWTNTAISNNCYNCLGKGEGITLVGVQHDDTTSNSSGNNYHGGTIEGNQVQNVDILGADKSIYSAVHIEQNAPVALAGTVSFTNLSAAVVGVGTSFTTAVKVGQYIKADAHAGSAWMRVQTITDNLNIVLTEVYQGATVAGAAASVVGGNVRVSSAAGAALDNQFLSCELGVASATCPGFYLQAGSNTMINMGDVNLPLILGVNAVTPTIWASGVSGGISDQCPTTRLFADSSNGRFYIKVGGVKKFSIVTGGVDTQFNTGQNAKFDNSVEATGSVKVTGSQVLTSRRLGWTAQTGAVARADMGGAPTLATVAATLTALINDLTTHGAIGP